MKNNRENQKEKNTSLSLILSLYFQAPNHTDAIISSMINRITSD